MFEAVGLVIPLKVTLSDVPAVKEAAVEAAIVIVPLVATLRVVKVLKPDPRVSVAEVVTNPVGKLDEQTSEAVRLEQY